MRRRNEGGDIVLGWLFKLIVSLAVFGFFAFEAGAVIISRVSIEGVAQDAVNEAALSYGRDQNPDNAEAAARTFAERNGAALVAFGVSADGKSVSVTVSKRAKTIVLHRIGATKGWTIASATRERGVY